MSTSKEQIAYQRKYIRERLFVLSSQLIIVSIMLFSWEYASNSGHLNKFIFSCPSEIIKTIIQMINNGDLYKHLFTTLNEIFLSFSLGLVMAFALAIIMYLNKIFMKIIDPFLTILNSLPKVAIGPMLIIWFGANAKSIVIMGILINLIVSTLTIYDGFQKIDDVKIKLFKSFRASKWQLMTKLIIPGATNSIISALKLNISMTLIGVIMGEFLVSKSGIGYLIIYGTQVFNLNLVLAGIVILLIISFILYIVVIFIEKIINR